MLDSGSWRTQKGMIEWNEASLYDDRLPVIKGMVASVASYSRGVLDLGCGSGRLMSCIPATVPYVGIDDSALIHSVPSLGRPGKVELFKADMTKGLSMLHGREFDTILAIFSLHFINSDQVYTLIKRTRELMSDSGNFIFIGHSDLSSKDLSDYVRCCLKDNKLTIRETRGETMTMIAGSVR